MDNKTLSLRYFSRYFRPYRLSIIVAFVFLILARAASTYEPILLKNIIDGLTRGDAFSVVSSILVTYFAIRFLTISFEYLRDYIFSPVIMGVSRDIEVAVFQHLLKLPVSYHTDQKSGAAARAIARGSQAITFVLDFSVSQILPPLFELAFVAILLFRLYSWHYAVITLTTIAIYTWFTIWSTDRRQKLRIEGNQKNDQASGILVDSVTNMDTVKFFNNERLQFKQFIAVKENWFHLLVRNNRLFALIYGAQGIILLIGLGLILVIAVKQATSGMITVGDLVLLSTYIVRLSIPITTLGFVYGQYKNSFADLEAMSNILSQEVTVKESENPTPLNTPKGEVVLDQVSFSYPSRDNVIDNLSITIKPAQSVAFVGSSGAGKSTIAKLLFRLYDVTRGEIRFDGIDVKEISAADRRKLMSIVPQEPALFNDTIENNIKFAQPNASHEQVVKAAKAAQIHDFIEQLPDGYQTKVGERGMKISGGEKQRVAIARAMVMDPKILLFDEATSSLDSRSEQAILSTLKSVAKGRTTIAIAHRLSTIVDSDVIYVLKQGRIVEEGTHRELLARNGVYASLWKLQSQTKHDEDDKQPE